MSLILIVSLAILLVGAFWSMYFLVRLRDRRMGFFTLALILMSAYQLHIFLGDKISQTISLSNFAAELPNLLVSIMAYIAVFCFEHIIIQQKHADEKINHQNELMGGILRELPTVAFTIDENGILQECSGAGLQRIGLNNRKLIKSNTFNEFTQNKEQALKAASGESHHYESHGVSENGPFWYDNFLSFDPDNKRAVGFAIDITEQKLAVQALRESEIKNQAFIKATPHLMFRIHDDGTYLEFKPTKNSNSLAPSKKFIGKKIYDVLPEDVAEKAMHYLTHTLQTGEIQIFDYQLRKNGRTCDYEARLIESSKNEVLAIVRNITERKEVKKALLNSEERFRSLTENAPVCIIEIDKQGNLIFMNSVGLKVMGVSNIKNAIGRAFLDLVAQEDRERVSDLLNKAFNAEPSECEYLALSNSGQKIFHSSFIPLKGAAGTVETIIGITQNITERKKTEGQLRKLYHAVEQSPSMVMITDPLGVIEYVNPRFSKITGYSSQDILGTNVNELGDIFAEDYEKIRQVLDAGKEWRGEFYNKKMNGEFYWEYASISSIKNSDGVITHYIKVAEDLTARKKLEEQLFQSQKMEAIGRLAGGVAHDFNNLLTAISGYTDFLLDGLSHNDPNRQDILEIQKAGERATLLTRQLLAFSRKQMLQQELLDINKIIKDFHNMLTRVIGENIELQTNLELNLASIWADAGQIQQALLNLCINSRDAMPKGGQLTIETFNLTEKQVKEKALSVNTGNNYVQLNIIDTGIGMEQNTLKQIFEPFYTTKEMGKGTGLGLSVVYGIVKQHNGHIEVESEIGKGTTFKVYIPSDPDAESGDKTKSNLPKLGDISKTILVVEDDETVRNVAVRILKNLNYKILMAENGLEAVKIFESDHERIDLVIMDVVMPKSSGPEAYEKMRTINSDMPVIFVTGYDARSEIGDLNLASDAPVTVLQKPYSKDSLEKKIREILSD